MLHFRWQEGAVLKKENIIIIGGGLAGLAASYYLKKNNIGSIVLEKENRIGGLCKSFSINNEWFDIGGHVSFAKDEKVRKLLENGVDYHERLADALNYKNGRWIVHPVQNNLYELDTEEKINIIKDFVNRPDIKNPGNYEEWLVSKYGNYFSQNYPSLYTKKYWTVDPKKLETKWVGERMYTPSLEEVLFGAFEEKTENVHYSNGVRYPLDGGFESFIKQMEEEATVECDTNISNIDLQNKTISINGRSEQQFDTLINTAPLPEIVKIIQDIPLEIKESAEKLFHTSLVLVSICLKGDSDHNYPAFYVYDQDILPSRVYSTNQYSGKRDGRRAIQAEIYYSKFLPLEEGLESVKNKTISQLVDMQIFKEEEMEAVDVRYIPYANIIFTPEIYDSRKKIRDYLESFGVYCAGRFGEWDYYWTDQTILSSLRTVEKILNIRKGVI